MSSHYWTLYVSAKNSVATFEITFTVKWFRAALKQNSSAVELWTLSSSIKLTTSNILDHNTQLAKVENFEARVVFLDTFFSEVFIVTLALATVSDPGSRKMSGARMYDWRTQVKCWLSLSQVCGWKSVFQ